MKRYWTFGVLGIFLMFAFVFFWNFDLNGEKSPGPAYYESPGKVGAGDLLKVQLRSAENVATNLQIPWEVVFLPGGEMMISERLGTLRIFGEESFSIEVPEVEHIGEGGLLGIAIHPNFAENRWIYVYQTTRSNGEIVNIVSRYVLGQGEIVERHIVISDIPGSNNHNGGRIAFGPDGFLYITTGDAGKPQEAQDTNSLAGKILRLRDDGRIPEDNPFGNAVYTFGHRNPQGLAWDSQGRLWSTEHGRSGLESGFDELNLIEKGKNYGWPVIEGDESEEGMESPIIHSGAQETWAPAGAVFFSGRIFFVGLRGEALYEVVLDEQGVTGEIMAHFENEFGRLRDVAVDTEGNLHIATSNRDGRGTPGLNDDRIIKVMP
jgi:aldose sugar dehydrogenase